MSAPRSWRVVRRLTRAGGVVLGDPERSGRPDAAARDARRDEPSAASGAAPAAVAGPACSAVAGARMGNVRCPTDARRGVERGRRQLVVVPAGRIRLEAARRVTGAGEEVAADRRAPALGRVRADLEGRRRAPPGRDGCGGDRGAASVGRTTLEEAPWKRPVTSARRRAHSRRGQSPRAPRTPVRSRPRAAEPPTGRFRPYDCGPRHEDDALQGRTLRGCNRTRPWRVGGPWPGLL